jgi:hypothetical protein
MFFDYNYFYKIYIHLKIISILTINFYLIILKHNYFYFLVLNECFLVIFFEIKVLYLIKFLLYKITFYLLTIYYNLIIIFNDILKIIIKIKNDTNLFDKKHKIILKYKIKFFSLKFLILLFYFIFNIKLNKSIHYYFSEIEIFLFSYSVYTIIYIYYSILNRFFFFLIIYVFKKKDYSKKI